MKTLILRSPGVVDNPEEFKRIGHSNIGYTADLNAINPSQPALFGFHAGEGLTTVHIEGATMYRVNGGVIDFANPSDGQLSWDINVDGSTTTFAFTPTKEKGYIRILNKGSNISNFLGAYTTSDAIQFKIDPAELKNMRNFVWDFPVPGGYSQKLTLIGDINGFSNSDKLITIGLPSGTSIITDFSYAYWSKPLPTTLTNFYGYQTSFKADIDLKIFDQTDLTELRVSNNLGLRFFGDISHLLTTASQMILWENFSHEGVTGSLGSIATNFEQILLNAPNLGGGYTTRTFTMSIVNLKINAPKIAATQWDLLLSDLANSASITGGVVQINKKTAASDASVATLMTKGVTVIVGF